MGQLIHAVGHGLSADDTIMLGNLVGGAGLSDNTLYYVLASGLTANDFKVSLTSGGTPITFTTDITDGVVVRSDVYTVVNDGVMDPPVAPDAPGSCVLSSATALAPDGTTITRLDITITQPTSATLRHTIVTVTGGGNTVKVVIPVGQTTGSIASVVPGVNYTGTAVSYDTFGLNSTETVSSAHLAVGDVTAPSAPTGLNVLGGILSIIASWTASSAVDLSHYEVQVDTVNTFATATTYKTKSNVITAIELQPAEYFVRVRAVDLTGNAGSYSATDSALSRLTDLVTNSVATVTIDPTGITILDGAINLKDASGNSVLNSAGFAGSWLDFLSSGLVYNALFRYGDTVDIAATQVGSGATIADYAASSGTTHLPYWVVASSAGTVKRVVAADASAGSALEFSGSASAVNRVYQDVPITALSSNHTIVVNLTYKDLSNVADKVTVYGSYRDSTHALIGSRVKLFEGSGPDAGDPTLTTYGTLVVQTDGSSPGAGVGGIGSAYGNTTYLRVELEVTHFTSTNVVRWSDVSVKDWDAITAVLRAENGAFGELSTTGDMSVGGQLNVSGDLMQIGAGLTHYTDAALQVTGGIVVGSFATGIANAAYITRPSALTLKVADNSGNMDIDVRGVVPTGSMMAYGGSSAPTGYLLCDGTSYLRASYADLFAVLGTTYGAADGTHFNVPDLRQRFPLGKAASGTGNALGATGGNIDHVHSGPSHTHTGPSHTHTSATHVHALGGHRHAGPSHVHSQSVGHQHELPFAKSGAGEADMSWISSATFGTGASRTRLRNVAGTGSSGLSPVYLTQFIVESDTDAAGTGNTGIEDTTSSGTTPGATGADGTAATGAGGTGNTGSNNAPFVVVNYIIKH